QQEALKAETIKAERPKLLEKIPAWKDPKIFSKEASELRDWLVSEGVAPDEVDAATSATVFGIAYKAMQYDRLLKAKAGKVKELRTAPPITRPGAAPGQAAAMA